MAKVVKAKRSCCQSRPRCKRCPVVLKRLAKSGAAEHTGKRRYRLTKVTKRKLRAARAR
jgi:hypothetical protein